MKTRFLLFACLFSIAAQANNMLVQNVTTLNNDPVNKTIQVQFDISWDNSWRDSINYDAAWIFIKFKDANGLWQHARLNQSGFNTGTGTADSVKVTSDKVGAWAYRSGLGSGTFSVTGMQLQWNYGLSGLTSVTGLEVRVFAVEMVYVPEGEFNVDKEIGTFSVSNNGNQTGFNPTYIYAPSTNIIVVNQKLTPTLSYTENAYILNSPSVSLNLRIKGNSGIDTNNDGVIDITSYPTGYKCFFSFKYELTEQQYADFLNTLTLTQKSGLGVAGSSISSVNGQYFSSNPNRACGYSNNIRLFAYADWSGLRPISFLEFHKAAYGPFPPSNLNGFNVYANSILSNVGSLANSTSNRIDAGATYYGHLDFSGNAIEPVISINSFNFEDVNGNGAIQSNGSCDISTWLNSTVKFIELSTTYSIVYNTSNSTCGFRYARSLD
jgi:hypothetical protein